MAEDKSKKYDRQLRIWGQHGQAALENAKICLLNAGPTGSEALKNLVLGGISGFTVVDGAKVSPRDLGNNFMVDSESLGVPRAKCVCSFLQELNESVTGSFVEEHPETLLASNPDFFDAFTMVIATQLPEHAALQLDELLRQKGIPLLLARSYGLMGYLRVSVEEHLVVESKPDSFVEDLRLHAPWPELAQYAATFDLGAMDDLQHKHVPWGVLLVQAAQSWRAAHGGALPANAAERREFKETVKGLRRSHDEENMDEAVANVHKVWSAPGVSTELKGVLHDPKAEVDASSTQFWVLVAALREFVAEEGTVPLEGSLPDMTSTTDHYVELQRIYREKANRDAAALGERAAALLKRAGSTLEIDPEQVKLFSKNARFLTVVRTRSLAAETSGASCKGGALQRMLGSEGDSANAALYVLLRAADQVSHTYGRFPGTFDGELDEDVSRLGKVAAALLADCGAAGAPLPDDLIGEMVRFGAGELHNVGAIVGGMAAQEAIKLITTQFAPLAGGLVYNGITSTTTLLSL